VLSAPIYCRLWHFSIKTETKSHTITGSAYTSHRISRAGRRSAVMLIGGGNTGRFKLLALAGEGARPTQHMSSTPPAKYRYRRRLPHLQKADASLFVTFCAAARTVLPEEARELVLKHCLREAGLNPFVGAGARAKPRIHLIAVVIMPDHAHLLLSPLRDESGWPFPLVDILQCLKSATAHRINKLFHISGPVWEEESFDHVLRSDESLKEKCEYIRQNPVKAGLVGRPGGLSMVVGESGRVGRAPSPANASSKTTLKVLAGNSHWEVKAQFVPDR
jgi:REP-associated tyrosine transposase